MHILEKWLLFVFCQRRRLQDQQQIETSLASDQLMEKQQQQLQHPDILDCPCRRILLEGGAGSSRPASHSPAQLEPITICADIHFQPDVVLLPESRFVSYSKRNSGIAIEDDIEILTPMASTEIPAKKQLEKHLNQKHSLDIQQQQPTNKSNTLTTINSINTINFHSDVSLSELQLNGSLLSLPLSMSLSLMPIPCSMMNSSSSWAAEEEFYDMDEYEERAVPWLQGDSDLNVKGV